jgi:hypothetical protein
VEPFEDFVTLAAYFGVVRQKLDEMTPVPGDSDSFTSSTIWCPLPSSSPWSSGVTPRMSYERRPPDSAR